MDTYMLHALQQVMLALRAAESDPAGTGTRQLAGEAMQVTGMKIFADATISFPCRRCWLLLYAVGCCTA